MSTISYGWECEPGGQPTPLGPTPEPSHTGCPGGSSEPGLIGGWTCPCECHKGSVNNVLTHDEGSDRGNNLMAQHS